MKKTNPILVTLLAGVVVVLAGVRLWQQFSPLHPQLVSLNDDTRNMALSRLAGLEANKKQALSPLLMEDLRQPDADVRRYAMYALRKIGSPNNDVVRAVAALLSDASEPVRQEAAVSLMEFGASVSGPALVELLRADANPAAQKNAVALARSWKPVADISMPGLLHALNAPEPMVRREAALAMIALSTETEKAVQTLIPFMKEPVEADLIDALGSAGSAARPATPSIIELLRKSNDSLINENAPRPLMARALAKIDPAPGALFNLSWDLKHSDPVVRYRAAYAISQMKDLDAGAVPVLVRALEDKDPYVVGRAVQALSRIGFRSLEPIASVAVPRLAAALGRVREEEVEGFRALLEPELMKLRGFSSAK